MVKIYTKTGDAGESGLVGGKRAKKDDQIFWVIGTLDELNALLGVSEIEIKNINNSDFEALVSAIRKVQRDLFQIGSEITSLHQNSQLENIISAEHISDFENQIDNWSNILPELNSFIFPGGSKSSAILHQARTVCRRAERELVALGKEMELRAELYSYLNRLSDWLFTAARYVNVLVDEVENKKE